MATPDEVRAGLAKSRSEFRAALEGVSANWERVPASGDGEDAWSARQAAEHAIGATLYFTNEVCKACGYPGPEMQQYSLATPQEAVTAFDTAVEASNAKLKYVTAEDLAKAHEQMGTVEGVMGVDTGHMSDHAAQITSAVS